MLQIGNKTIDTMYVGGKLVQQAYLGSTKVYPFHGVIPKAIKDSMVLWYDIKRQGATNENMAENPVLRDLSGNGHDATCYNFAWSRGSGIGGDIAPLIALNQILGSSESFGKDPDAEFINFRKFVINSNSNVYASFDSQDISDDALGSTITLGSFQFIVSGLKEGDRVSVSEQYGDNFTDLKTINCDSDGLYTFPELSVNIPSSVESGRYITQLEFGGKNTIKSNSNVTIEILPQYPNALVSDGVDDYAYVEGLPILTDYTVIAKRKRLDIDLGKRGAIASKLPTGNSIDGAFAFEFSADANEKRAISFGAFSNINFEETDICYQTKNYYNGVNITLGNNLDTDHLSLLSIRENNGCAQAALYSFILFDRTLTTAEIEWVKKNMVEGNNDDVDWYGVEFYTTSPYPDCIRIGNHELHKTLPVHSQMKGVLLSDDGTVNKYLNESDWTSETLDGSQGQVMVEMPKQSYWKFETDGNIRRVKFSTKPLPGFKKTPQGYVSAYEAALQRSTRKLASVVNTTADYRGGDNNTGWDGTYRSLLGMPATEISRTNFRNYARNRKADSTEWNCMTYDMQKLLYWLFVVEYGTLNSQKAFNADKDANGCAQGGLGNGVTNLNVTKWYALNSNCPVIKCGYTNSLGSGTGQIPYTMPFEYDANRAANYAGEYDAEAAYTDGLFVSQGQELYECIADAAAGTALTDTTYFKKVTRTVNYVPRYRGVENPFGHIWQWTDGINVRISPTTEDGGDNLSKVFVCSDPAQFKDNGYEGYTYVGNEARTAQYVKEVIFGEGGEIMPKVVGDGAGSTKYFCDYYYTKIPTTETLSGVLFGGIANQGASAGFAYANSYYACSNTSSQIGSRLCFISE